MTDTPTVDVCVVGSANLDLVARASRLPLPGETVLGTSYAEHPGGKGLNQAVACARAGAHVAFVAAVGTDNAGDVLEGVARAEGVDVSGVARWDGPTGRALIGVSDDAENSIIVVPGANATVTAQRVSASMPAARVVLAQLEIPIDAVIAAFRAARSAGAMTVLNPAPATPLPSELLALCDVIVPNEHELALIGGAEHLRDQGVRTVVTTLGGRGARIESDGVVTDVEPFPVTPVDSTGAGDAFNGTLAALLAEGAGIEAAVRSASAAGALATTVHGAVPSLPRREAIDALVSGAS